ncbi:hypothetical protein JW721_04295 [Candidatus Micrarchaeota archaeon]|nr:hypothetical protein [Candidatus Micrarchaeota archaeon]
MKLKLTPQLSYFIGLWKEKRGKEGIGVYGDEEFLSIFAKAALEFKLTEPNKLLTAQEEGEEEQGTLYFYNSAYRKFFQGIINDELERFKYRNEYSASFLAGLFDATGGISKDGKVFLSRCTQKDEMVLYRLGFNPVKRMGKLYFTKPLKFLAYIGPFTKKYGDHPILKKIQKGAAQVE